jgi:predicted DNA-binding transcriptional regulator AlpA
VSADLARLAALLDEEVERAAVGDLPSAIGLLAAAQAKLTARMVIALPAAAQEASSNGDHALTVREAAALLGQKPSWVYRHASDLPQIHLPGSRSLRFSEARLRRRTGLR